MGTDGTIEVCNPELETRNPELEFIGPRTAWRGGAATEPELVLQEAAEDTEELICPLITRICADALPHDPRSSALSAEDSGHEVFFAISATSCRIRIEVLTAKQRRE